MTSEPGRLLMGFVLLIAAGRGFFLASSPVRPLSNLDPLRTQVLQMISSGDFVDVAGIAGVDSIQWQRFDPTAAVTLRPGPDGQPGTRDFDDNANGVIDDAAELGATHSDDRCVVEPAESSDALAEEPTLVLQRGAFVPVNFSDLDPHSDAVRAVVSGRDDEGAWSFQVGVFSF